MNVFVTGGAGYIGSICTEELLNAGHQVTVYDNLSESHRPAVDPRASLGRSASLNWRRHNLAPRHHAYLPRPDHRVRRRVWN